MRSRSLRDRIQLGQIVVEYLNTENIAHTLRKPREPLDLWIALINWGCLESSHYVPTKEYCELHANHACRMHEPGTAARIWTCDVWWAANTGAARICNSVSCVCPSDTRCA